MLLRKHIYTDVQPGSWEQAATANINVESTKYSKVRVVQNIPNGLTQDPSQHHDQGEQSSYSQQPLAPSMVQHHHSVSDSATRKQPLSIVSERVSEVANSSLHALKSKASVSSISSVSSIGSNITAQTFMSTQSFVTVTEEHMRSTTQESTSGLSVASGPRIRGIAADDEENPEESQIDEQVDLRSLDVVILTPGRSADIDPFDSLYEHGQSQAHHRYNDVYARDPSLNNHRLIASSGGHARYHSQMSSGATTIKERHSAETSAAHLSSLPTSSTSVRSYQTQSPSQDYRINGDESTEDMMFASPGYRKSIASSEHSEVALDIASPSSRGSSAYISDKNPRYTNLLRDATLVIGQQQQFQGDRAENTENLGPNMHSSSSKDNHSDYDIGLSLASMELNIAPKTAEAPVTAPTAEKNPASSGRNTLVRSRSRRFSAPDSSYTSLSAPSISIGSMMEGTVPPIQEANPRAPQTFAGWIQSIQGGPEDTDGRLYLPGVQPIFQLQESKCNLGLPLLQHHPTMQSSFPTAANEGSISGPSFNPSSSAFQNQAHYRRDYRPGVVFEYYEGEWDWLPNFDEMRPDNVGIVGNFMIDETTEQDLFRPQYTQQIRRRYKESGNFAVRFTTHIDITQDGVYSFWLTSNDGSAMYVANTLVVENDGMHYATETEGRIMLQAGKHPMTVEFFHKNGKMLEGFRSTGPSLVVSYRAPGPIWSFGLKAGPKKIIQSSNLFYDHGDIRLKNLLREFGVEEDRSITNTDVALDVDDRMIAGGPRAHWPQGSSSHHHSSRPSRHRILSGDMGAMQPSNRELHVQMENAKTTIKDLEQIIRDQAESHKKKMAELYNILQETQAQVDRLVTGLKKATLFETPQATIPASHIHSHGNIKNPTWRSSVISVYVDAEEDYQSQEPIESAGGEDTSNNENETDSDGILTKHIADVERLKQLYFFSMALSVKMNSEMMGKKTPEYISMSVQKLYEDCTVHSKIPVERWPGFVSRYFARRPTA